LSFLEELENNRIITEIPETTTHVYRMSRDHILGKTSQKNMG
jgi:hypothetical protein